MNTADVYAEKQVNFWTTKDDACTVIGDYLGRIPAIELLQPQPQENILEAGCGAGWCTRRIARLGANTYGCDRAPLMLNQAKQHEQNRPLGIEYCLADIISLPYPNEMFDVVACIAVLIHASPEECLAFFDEALRVLKPSGRIVTSIMHSALYTSDSPNRNHQASWAQYTPIGTVSDFDSQPFQEVYRDSQGNEFVSTVWNHPKLHKILQQIGLQVKTVCDQYVTQAVLRACNQTGPISYPAFQQILARKLP